MFTDGPIHDESRRPCRVEAWGVVISGMVLAVVGFIAGIPVALSLASIFCGCGIILLSRGKEHSQLNSFWIAVPAWLAGSSLAVAELFDRVTLVTRLPWVSNAWPLFTGIAAILFISVKVSASRVGEQRQVTSLLRELFTLSLVAAFASWNSRTQPSVLANFAAVILQLWAIGTSVEGLLRLMIAMLSGQTLSESLSTEFLLRQVTSGTASPRHAIMEDCESSEAHMRRQRSGSKSIRRVFMAGAITTAFIVWSVSGLTIVRTGHRAAFYRLGILQPNMLSPGIHLTLPFPLARTMQFPVEQMKAMTVGFAADPVRLSTQPMLWTKPHGDAEFPLIVGDGTELVAINAVVQYRVSDTPERLKSYATFARDHDTILRGLSQHVLMAETRTMTLQGLLSTDRNNWGQQLRSHLQDEVLQNQLGLEVVQFDVLSIHPPIDVAESFLDIVAARVDAEKEIAEARGAYVAERLRCEMMAATDAADASAAASVRLTSVMDEALHLESLATVDKENTVVFRRRAFCNALAEVLTARNITLIDQKLPSDLKLWLGSQREIHPEAGR